MKTIIGIVLVLTLTVVPTKHAHGQASVDSNVIYGMYSGLALLMDVHYPTVSNGYGIIMIPGSGWHAPLGTNAAPLKNGISRQFFRADLLLDSGYTIFVINHRAAPRFKYPAAVEDAQRAVRFIRFHSAKYKIDPNRIGALGSSSGGHLVSMLGVLSGRGDPLSVDAIDHESANVQAVVALWPATDFVDFAQNPNMGGTAMVSFLGAYLSGRQLRDIESQEVTQSLEFQIHKEASPTSHVSSDDAPFLLVHGDADDVVPFSQSELFHEALSAAGVPVEFIRIPGGGHGGRIADGTSAPDYFGPMLNWFDAHLRIDSK